MMHALMTVVVLAATPEAAWPSERVEFGVNDDDGNLTIQLSPDGSCRISATPKGSRSTSWVRCHFWLHGSRVRLRVAGEKDGNGFNAMDIEYVPQSDTLIVHGNQSKQLTRRPASSGST